MFLLEPNKRALAYLSPKPPKLRMARVIGALILRETGSRDSRASLGFLWQVIEPVVSIAILSVLFSMISRSPPLGTNFPLYYVTGVVPFHLYASIGRQVSGSMRFSRNLLGLPAVTVVVPPWVLLPATVQVPVPCLFTPESPMAPLPLLICPVT